MATLSDKSQKVINSMEGQELKSLNLGRVDENGQRVEHANVIESKEGRITLNRNPDGTNKSVIIRPHDGSEPQVIEDPKEIENVVNQVQDKTKDSTFSKERMYREERDVYGTLPEDKHDLANERFVRDKGDLAYQKFEGVDKDGNRVTSEVIQNEQGDKVTIITDGQGKQKMITVPHDAVGDEKLIEHNQPKIDEFTNNMDKNRVNPDMKVDNPEQNIDKDSVDRKNGISGTIDKASNSPQTEIDNSGGYENSQVVRGTDNDINIKYKDKGSRDIEQVTISDKKGNHMVLDSDQSKEHATQLNNIKDKDGKTISQHRDEQIERENDPNRVTSSLNKDNIEKVDIVPFGFDIKGKDGSQVDVRYKVGTNDIHSITVKDKDGNITNYTGEEAKAYAETIKSTKEPTTNQTLDFYRQLTKSDDPRGFEDEVKPQQQQQQNTSQNNNVDTRGNPTPQAQANNRQVASNPNMENAMRQVNESNVDTKSMDQSNTPNKKMNTNDIQVAQVGSTPPSKGQGAAIG